MIFFTEIYMDFIYLFISLLFLLTLCLRQMIPVAANDVAFSIHAVLLTAITLFQIVIYDVSFTSFFVAWVSTYPRFCKLNTNVSLVWFYAAWDAKGF